MFFSQGQNFKLTVELSEKVQYFRNQAIKTARMKQNCLQCMSINEALLSR